MEDIKKIKYDNAVQSSEFKITKHRLVVPINFAVILGWVGVHLQRSVRRSFSFFLGTLALS